MVNKFDVVIIGAGASGVTCAIKAKQNGVNVALVDSSFYPCKKLLVTGNGRCNLTNTKIENKNYNQNLDLFFKRISNIETIKFFNQLGLETFSDDEGRVYPITNSAKSVVDVLNYKLKKLNIPVFSETTILNIEKNDNFYSLKCDNCEFKSKKVVVATGGVFENCLLHNLDIKIRKPVPSLVSLKTEENTKMLSGVKLSCVLVDGFINGKKIFSQKGEVLFKDKGLSGIVIFNLSSQFARNNQFDGNVVIDLMPNYSDKELFKIIKDRLKKFKHVKDLFMGMFVPAIANDIISRCRLNFNQQSLNLSDNDIFNLIAIIKGLSFKIVDCYDNNQVFSGGVLLEGLDENLQSKLNKNLYFCGEVCDVDGECGGYNLQWAWTSGMIVGESL